MRVYRTRTRVIVAPEPYNLLCFVRFRETKLPGSEYWKVLEENSEVSISDEYCMVEASVIIMYYQH